MKKCCFLSVGLLWLLQVTAQTVAIKLSKAIQQLEADPQLQQAIVGFWVKDAKTGKTVYAHNEQMGLAPASTQKLFTSAAAFDILGKDFRYTTSLRFFNTTQNNGVADGILLIRGSGDPTLGSWRFTTTTDTLILNKWTVALRNRGIRRINGFIRVEDAGFGDMLSIPPGYIWEDMGNYYGAGATLVNWHENQYDLFFNSTETNSRATLQRIVPEQQQVGFINDVRSGAAGSGDNAFIYCAPYTRLAYITGTIPPNSKNFSISGAMPDPAYTLGVTFRNWLRTNGIGIDTLVTTLRTYGMADGAAAQYEEVKNSEHLSPPLDSINYWFLKKSINLYGEALMKTIGQRLTGSYSLDSGLQQVKAFWQSKGIAKGALHLQDGSGLSPQNRVTTQAQVAVLQYARSRPWFASFYNALPEYNGMKMKSGSIGGTRAYAGYHTARDGNAYVFSIIVNNYDGATGSVVKKIYAVLDLLK